ncbi:MAG: ParB N-terminal domain-containing protein [Chloroflexi bacterium]|nr:ParB N-terminal domain-containing protein [Chloroflexota bacterium]
MSDTEPTDSSRMVVTEDAASSDGSVAVIQSERRVRRARAHDAKHARDISDINLKIVSLDEVIVHEGIDPLRVERLVASLQRDGVLRSPPIVTRASDYGRTRYIVLDGATRTSALRALGYRDVLVQVVEYTSGNVTLHSWYHLLEGIKSVEFLTQVRELPVRVILMHQYDALEAMDERALICVIGLHDRTVWGVQTDGDLNAQNAMLNRVVDLYRGKAQVHRVTTTHLDTLFREHPQLAALVVFPDYAPSEVTRLAMSGNLIPMGITRHLIGGRALGVNFDLQILAAEMSLEEKNKRLEEWLMSRVRERKVRYYGEPVFLFED